MRRLAIFLLLTFCLADDPWLWNPFYVDRQSVKKTQSKWTMNLKNKHEGGVQATNDEVMHARVEIESYDKNVLRFKMYDERSKRWEVPLANPNPKKDFKPVSIESMGFTFSVDPFTFRVIDPISGDALIDTSKDAAGSLKFYDKYLEIGLRYPHKHIFGMGQRVTETFELCPRKTPCFYTTFNKDAAHWPDPAKEKEGRNMYGSQPFYLIQTLKGDFMAVLFNNLNDQDTVLVPGQGKSNIYHKSTGGVFEFYFFFRGSVDSILKKYHSLIGKPYVPPFWSLGFHLSHWGWKTVDIMRQAVNNMNAADIPLEVVWSDLDYMKDFADFTVDPIRYRGFGEYVKSLHRDNMRWVPLIDAGIKVDKADPIYQKGEEKGVFVKSAVTGKSLVGVVWPGKAVFGDWYHPEMSPYWQYALNILYKKAEFDGVWIDMNDVSSFVKGEVILPREEEPSLRRNLRQVSSSHYDPKNHDPHEFDDLPYYPGGEDLNDKTLSMTGYHYSTNDDEDRLRKEYNVHNLFCLKEAESTHKFFSEKLKRRPFVLTRSQVPGSGIFTSLWLGDNYSDWRFMRYSINGLYSYQMFGMPLVGADMCGFIGNSNEQLCARWMQLGAFYPFSRNHNANDTIAQEPYAFGERVKIASRNALRQKYSVLWYYYTKLYEVSLNGGTMIQPLYFEYPLDEKAFTKNEHEFMVGPALLIAPVLDKDLEKTFPYVSNENWYSLFNRNMLCAYNPDKTQGCDLELPGGYDYVQVLLRGGHIVPFQNALGFKTKRTIELRSKPMELVIGPDHKGEAVGTLIVDDGVSVEPIKNGAYRYLAFTFSKQKASLSVEVKHDYQRHDAFEKLRYVTILGSEGWSGMKKACAKSQTEEKVEMSASYNSEDKSITFTAYNSGLYWDKIKSIAFGKSC